MLAYNPLATLGVPKDLVERELAKGDAGLKRIQELARRYHRQLAWLYHPDQQDGDVGLFNLYAEAREELESLAAVEVWAGMLTGSASLYAAQAERLAKSAAKDDIRAVFTRMLAYVNPMTIAGCDEPTELLFGLPYYLSKETTVYSSTFTVRVAGMDNALFNLPHACTDDVVDSFTSDESVRWDEKAGRWLVGHFAGLQEGYGFEPEDAYHLTPEPRGTVRLVGAVGGDDVLRLSAMLAVAPEADQFQIVGGQVELEDRLSWYPLHRAWWLRAMRGDLRVGDHGVLLHPTTNHLALVGQLRETRLLTS